MEAQHRRPELEVPAGWLAGRLAGWLEAPAEERSALAARRPLAVHLRSLHGQCLGAETTWRRRWPGPWGLEDAVLAACLNEKVRLPICTCPKQECGRRGSAAFREDIQGIPHSAHQMETCIALGCDCGEDDHERTSVANRSSKCSPDNGRSVLPRSVAQMMTTMMQRLPKRKKQLLEGFVQPLAAQTCSSKSMETRFAHLVKPQRCPSQWLGTTHRARLQSPELALSRCLGPALPSIRQEWHEDDCHRKPMASGTRATWRRWPKTRTAFGSACHCDGHEGLPCTDP